MTDESIEHIIKDRLDSIFGFDEGEEDLPDAPAQLRATFLEPLSQAVTELEKGFSPERLKSLDSSLQALQKSHGKDPLFLPLLKMMYILATQLKTSQPEMNRAALVSARSVLDCMEAVTGDHALSNDEKRKLIRKEIDSFKAHQGSLRASKPPDKPAEKPDSAPAAEEVSIPVEVLETSVETDTHSSGPAEKPPESSVSHPRLETPPPGNDAPAPAVISQLHDLNSRIDVIIKTLESEVEFRSLLRRKVSQIETRVNALSNLPEAIQALIKKTLENTPQKHESAAPKPPGIEDIQSVVRKVIAENRESGPDGIHDLPVRLRELHESMTEAFSSLSMRIEELHADVRSALKELRSTPAISDYPEPSEDRMRVNVKDPFETAEPGYLYPFEEDSIAGATEETVFSEREIHEYPQSSDHFIPPVRPGFPTGRYFLFSISGKKYALDEQYVIKSSETEAGLREKALARGGLTVSDSSPDLPGTKMGVEPPWSSIPSEELEQNLFRLAPGGALEGLNETNGEGILYLGVENERILLFTDRPAEKITLGRGDEVNMSGAGKSFGGAVAGSIQRSGEAGEFYLILSPEKII